MVALKVDKIIIITIIIIINFKKSISESGIL